MGSAILQRFPELRSSNGHLVVRPAEIPREQGHADALDGVVEVFPRPRPDLLLVKVPEPLVERPLEAALHDVDEAGAVQGSPGEATESPTNHAGREYNTGKASPSVAETRTK